ncbi:phage tail tape measure protein, partial [Aquitalea sp. ASV11]|uniref:phage tail tape measure protein n=1 Tax=Aquitalea sp. ASV11 TaxID=2795103 RepID=UPI0018EAC026
MSATLGQAVGKTSQSLAVLQKSLADSSGIRNLIGETQRLQREMAEADKAGRRLGLESVRQLRGEVGKLETDWKNATREVANMAGQLAQAKSAGQSGLLPALEQEYQVLRQAARQTAELSTQRRQAWQQAKAGGQASAEEIRTLKQQADAARLASKESRQLLQAKRQQRDAARQAMDTEHALSQAFNKARDAASQAKRAFEDKRRSLHDTRNSLNSTAVVIGSTVSQTVRLGDAIRQTATVGSTMRQSLDLNIGKLRAMGVEVGNLDKALHHLQQKEKGMQWQQHGLGQIQSGLAMGKQAGAMMIGASVLPTTSAASYQSVIRDIAIKDGIAGTVKEQEMKEQLVGSAKQSGMNVNDMAQGINMLVEKGMKVDEALKLGPLLSKFTVGQNAQSADVASMMYSIYKTAGVKDEQGMQQAMETIAFHGKDGSFEAKDMAKAFPELLAQMANKGIVGQNAVNELAAMLQVQMQVTASPETAANNLQNWMAKIGSPETVASYEKAGLNYKKSTENFIKAGHSPLEATMQVAKQWIERSDPEQAKRMQEQAAQLAGVE